MVSFRLSILLLVVTALTLVSCNVTPMQWSWPYNPGFELTRRPNTLGEVGLLERRLALPPGYLGTAFASYNHGDEGHQQSVQGVLDNEHVRFFQVHMSPNEYGDYVIPWRSRHRIDGTEAPHILYVRIRPGGKVHPILTAQVENSVVPNYPRGVWTTLSESITTPKNDLERYWGGLHL